MFSGWSASSHGVHRSQSDSNVVKRRTGFGSSSTRFLRDSLKKSTDFATFRAAQQRASRSAELAPEAPETQQQQQQHPSNRQSSPQEPSPTSSSSNSFNQINHATNQTEATRSSQNKPKRAVQIQMPSPEKLTAKTISGGSYVTKSATTATTTGTSTVATTAFEDSKDSLMDHTQSCTQFTERFDEEPVLRETSSGAGKQPNDESNNNNNNGSSRSKSAANQDNKDKSWLDQSRTAVGTWVNQPKVQITVIVLIVVNALLMGLGTFDWVTENEQRNHRFEVTDQAFLVVFTVELAMQLYYHGWALFCDGWLVFDFVIIVTSWSFSSMQVIRTFRIFRAFRLITRLKVLRNLVTAIFEVMPSLFAIVCLLLLVLYIYAVLCTVLFSDLYKRGVTSEDYFGRLDITLFWLFRMMTLEWADIAREVMAEYWWAQVVFGSFLCVSSFILYSLIIAVICDAVAVTEHEDDKVLEQQAKEQTRQHIQHLERRLHDMTRQQMDLHRSLQLALAQIESHNKQQQRQRNGAAGDEEEDTSISALGESSSPTTTQQQGEPQQQSVSTLGSEQESDSSLNIWDAVAQTPRVRLE